ncbi:MAG: 4'-phosphopantetheinyl transferase superfamily protein [Rhodocyclaceae bacterium]|nr:MAG: 4'-phosphopantetheinyl transferase superfamily protein [Rhodocyclaceae bacterium]
MMFEKIDLLGPKKLTSLTLGSSILGDHLVMTNWSLDQPDLTVAVGKMHSPILERSAIRKIQSNSVRELLNKLLFEKFPNTANECWTVSAPGTGRPQLSGPVNLDVSFSHRLAWVACAISDGQRVGIDLEPILGKFDELTLDLFLSPSEITWMKQMPQSERGCMAIVLWCLKEAWLKASNLAGSVAMHHVVFSSELELLSVNDQIQKNRWKSLAWKLDEDLIIAVCIENQ